MICPKCKNTLPDDSEFCQYCGEKISNPAPEQTSPIPPQSDFSPNPPKLKYCSRCGSLIDQDTKVCTGCGKKYFNWAKIFNIKNWKYVVPAILSILLVLSIISNITQAAEIEKYSKEREEYRDALWFYQKYVVIINEDGSKYHEYGCSRIKSEARIIFKKSAQSQGYEPCYYCYPFD